MERTTHRRTVAGVRAVIPIYLFFFLTATQPLHSQEQISYERQSSPAGELAPARSGRTSNYAETNKLKTSSQLRIGPGDLVEMSVFNVPEIASKTRITSDGNGYFPLLGYVHLAGLTAEESQSLLEQRLSAFLKAPSVSFYVSEYASQGVSVLGEVSKPGVYPFRGEPRLLDLISAAGGMTEKAGYAITITHEDDPDNPVTIELSPDVSDNGKSNVKIEPHDTIAVHKAGIVYVLGEVAKPSGLLIERGGLTVLRAIALAGGTTRNAKLTVKILRYESGKLTEKDVPLKRILSAKAPDPRLAADDIVVVPTSAGKTLAGRTLEAAIQAATLVTVAAVQ
jgi:polysaccharide biosynthesis/export protein